MAQTRPSWASLGTFAKQTLTDMKIPKQSPFKYLTSAILASLYLAASSFGQDPISIANQSFETPAVPVDGGLGGLPLGWVAYSADPLVTAVVGVWNPLPTNYDDI